MVMIIHNATGWLEIVQLDIKTVAHVTKKVDAQWLCSYQCTSKIICDNGWGAYWQGIPRVLV